MPSFSGIEQQEERAQARMFVRCVREVVAIGDAESVLENFNRSASGYADLPAVDRIKGKVSMVQALRIADANPADDAPMEKFFLGLSAPRRRLALWSAWTCAGMEQEQKSADTSKPVPSPSGPAVRLQPWFAR